MNDRGLDLLNRIQAGLLDSDSLDSSDRNLVAIAYDSEKIRKHKANKRLDKRIKDGNTFMDRRGL